MDTVIAAPGVTPFNETAKVSPFVEALALVIDLLHFHFCGKTGAVQR